MQHIDSDALMLIALGEQEPDAAASAHLDVCEQCRTELSGLGRVVLAGRREHSGDLVHPPAHVWTNILATVREEPPAAPTSANRQEHRRRVPAWFAVAAGVALGLGGGLLTAALVDDEPDSAESAVVASAELEPLGDAGVSGSAQVSQTEDGRVLEVRLNEVAAGAGYREVWLLDADAGRLVSLGVINGRQGSFVLPDSLDLGAYPTVDVSREPLDGDPTHSGDSLARGALEL